MAHLYILFNRRQKVSKAASRLHNLCDIEIYQTTRFPRAAVQELCEFVHEDVVRQIQRSNAIPVDTQMLAALQFYASGSFQWVIGRSCRLSNFHAVAGFRNVIGAIDCRLVLICNVVY